MITRKGVDSVAQQSAHAISPRADGWPSGPNDGYLFEHLANHLIRAGRASELHAVLEDRRWYEAKRTIDASLGGVIQDIEAALNHAEKSSPSDNSTLVACSLLHARSIARLKDAPLELLVALARLGRWKRALTYARMVRPPERRLLGLRMAAEVLSDRRPLQSGDRALATCMIDVSDVSGRWNDSDPRSSVIDEGV